MTTLAELRLANLREQKKTAPDPITPEAAPPAANAEAAPPVPLAGASAYAASPAREDDLVLAQYLTDADQSLPTPADSEKSAALIARVHAALEHKTQHPNGAKATVDMSPALFHRAKRYCLDHGNVTLRQLFLDLMTAFLEEEGY